MSARPKLSKAQSALLDHLRRGEVLVRLWDVWGPRPDGYWWELRVRAPAGAGCKVGKRTAEALERSGWIVGGEERRPYGGHRERPYTIAEPSP